jgi:hypothetical protein
MTLRTRNVFINTSIFVGANFALDSEVFKSLATLTQKNSVVVKLTDVTVNEIKANISESAQSSAQALKPFRKEARILRNLVDPKYEWLFRDFPSQEVTARVEKVFDDYVAEVGAEVLLATTANAKPIFDKYFNQEPPFGTGKKKSEFPDAFTLAALEKWCGDNSTEIYVVSGDADMKAACDKSRVLHHLGSLKEFISLVLETDNDLDLILQRVAKNIEKIENAIRDQFLDNGAWLKDQDGEVTDLNVAEVNIDSEAVSVIRISDERATIEVPVRIDYEADVKYPDPNSRFYDNEDKRVYYFDTISDSVQAEYECNAEIVVMFSGVDEQKFDIEKVILDSNEPVGVIADEDAWNFYK